MLFEASELLATNSSPAPLPCPRSTWMLFEAWAAVQGQSTMGKLVLLADGVTSSSLLHEVGGKSMLVYKILMHEVDGGSTLWPYFKIIMHEVGGGSTL